MIDIFPDMKALGIKLEAKDLIADSKVASHLEQHEIEDKEVLKEYLKSEQGGGGIAKCFPVSYI